MILIVGATGDLGSAIARALLAKGEDIRILVRDLAKAKPLIDAGAKPVVGDLKDPASLATACVGVDTVITTANSARRGPPDTIETVDDKGNAALIEAAKNAGVRRFVFVSAFGADVANPVPLLAAKGRTEQRLRESAMTHTIVRPNIFTEIWVGAVVLGPVMEGKEVRYVGGDHKHAFISQQDVVDFIVAALERDRGDRTLALGGPEAVSWRDICATVERVMERRLAHRSAAPHEITHLPDTMVGLLAAMDTYDSLIPMEDTAREFGVRQRSLEETVRAMIGR